MRFWLILFLITTNLPGLRQPLAAPAQVEISDLKVDYRYGEQAVFTARINPAEETQELYLFIQAQGEAARSEKVSANGDGEISFTYDLKQKPLRPFTTVEFWIRASVAGQEPVQSDHQYFDYDDNRFTWQALDDGDYHVRWIQGDLSFGQAILDTAIAGLRSAAGYLDYELPGPLKIFVYLRASDLQSALQVGSKTWIAGHASPDLGVILVSIPAGPEQQLELERQLPHEIMHVLTYAIVGDSYAQLPAWFMEGMASLAELNPNPDYQIALDRARETSTLVSFSSMCASFPREASGAFLAYAESASFVRFLQQKFGSTGIQDVVTNYQNGMGCEEGVSAALGSSLEQLTIRWQREVLGMDTGALVFANLAPYLAAGALLVILPLALAIAFISLKKPHSNEKPA